MFKDERHTQTLRDSIHAGKRMAAHEQDASTGGFWRDFGATTTPYEITFPGFLADWRALDFDTLLINAAHSLHWRTCHALDVGAPPGSFLAKHGQIEKGVALTLADTRLPSQIAIDTQFGRHLVTGHILQRVTWRHLAAVMHTAQIGAFDLIVCRPLGGMLDDPRFAEFYASILSRMYQLLSAHKGLLITEVPYYPGVVERLADLSLAWRRVGLGVFIQPPETAYETAAQRDYGQRSALMLIKPMHAPSKLPMR